MKTYYEVALGRCSGGFGEWQRLGDMGKGWDCLSDLLEAAEANIGPLYDLGGNDLPEGMEDIRGRIQDEPEMIFGFFDASGAAAYFGISEGAAR